MISLALGMLLLAAPQERTVEDRIRELESRLEALEKRAAAAKSENEKLEKRLADVERAKERYILGRAAAWVKQTAVPAKLSKERCAELEKLWVGWMRADFGKRPDGTAWKKREAEVRKLLKPGESERLAKAVRDGQVAYAKSSVEKFAKYAEIGADRGEAFQSAVLDRIRFVESALLLPAHPEARVDWMRVYRSVEKAEPDLGGVLTDGERSRLRTLLEKWKPKPIPFTPRGAPEK